MIHLPQPPEVLVLTGVSHHTWPQTTKIRTEKGYIIPIDRRKKGIKREYHEQLYVNKLDNLDEMDKFLQRHKVQKWNQEKPEDLNRPITS